MLAKTIKPGQETKERFIRSNNNKTKQQSQHNNNNIEVKKRTTAKIKRTTTKKRKEKKNLFPGPSYNLHPNTSPSHKVLKYLMNIRPQDLCNVVLYTGRESIGHPI